MALDIDLPRQILTHAHWTLGHRKMSKSLGNVVNPFFALDRFGQDPLRYFMIRDGGIQNDSAYDNSYVVKRYRTELAAVMGNLLRRINRSSHWDVREAVQAAVRSSWQSADERSQGHMDLLSGTRDRVDRRFDQLDPSGALEEIMSTVNKVRRDPVRYLQFALTQ
jgi:methionyl-tRNA synthetase